MTAPAALCAAWSVLKAVQPVTEWANQDPRKIVNITISSEFE